MADPDRPARWRQHAAVLAAMISTTLVVMLAWAAWQVSRR